MIDTTTCQQIQQRLNGLAGEYLNLADDPALNAHLANCPACASVAANIQRDRERLGAFLQAAPWSPVERRPWQEAPNPHAAHGGWNRIATGMNWVAGLGIVAVFALALALVVPVMARSGGAGAGSAPAATSTTMPAGALCVSSAGTPIPGGPTPTPVPYDPATPAIIPPRNGCPPPVIECVAAPTPTPATINSMGTPTAVPTSAQPRQVVTIVCPTITPSGEPAVIIPTPDPYDPAAPTPTPVPYDTGTATPTPASAR